MNIITHTKFVSSHVVNVSAFSANMWCSTVVNVKNMLCRSAEKIPPGSEKFSQSKYFAGKMVTNENSLQKCRDLHPQSCCNVFSEGYARTYDPRKHTQDLCWARVNVQYFFFYKKLCGVQNSGYYGDFANGLYSY